MPSNRIVWPALVLGTIVFYSILLFSPQASIHWDLADVFYPVQKYISDSLHAGRLPSWAPYLFSGTPLGSDPQSGFWYPPHWLFFLIGVTPRLMAWEVALHVFLALAGAYLLAKRLFNDEMSAILTGVFYAAGGFFAANNPELPLLEAASLFPWLLWTAHAGLETGSRNWIGASGLVAGLIVLTGDFDASVYCFFGLVCFVAVQRAPLPRTGILLGSTAILGALIGAVIILPWLEIVAHTTRTGFDAEGLAGVNLQPPALGTILSADYLGLFSGRYSGPDDMRHAYYYGGLLVVPLAIAGFFRRERIWTLLALIVPAIWYAFGPVAFLARALAAVFPTFRDVRAPAEIWFVAALGFALAAGSGAAFITTATGRKHLPYIFLFLTVVDLWFWNFYRNPMVMARVSFEQIYERSGQRFAAQIAELRKQPYYRIGSPQPANAFGPLNGALAARVPVTYGYKLLETQRHAAYKLEMPGNPRLLNTLATHLLDLSRGAITQNPQALGLVSAPGAVVFVENEATARKAIGSINPAETAVVEASSRPFTPGPIKITSTVLDDSRVQVSYSATSEAFLRIAIPWAPGWSAAIDKQPAPLFPTDSAFLGVFAPAGSHQITLVFAPANFAGGWALSLAGLAIALALTGKSRKKV